MVMVMAMVMLMVGMLRSEAEAAQADKFWIALLSITWAMADLLEGSEGVGDGVASIVCDDESDERVGGGVPNNVCDDERVGDGVPGNVRNEDASLLGELLLRNCSRVSRMGSYIGLFEWALFAYWFSVQVIIHLACGIVNPIQYLLPGLVTAHSERVRRAGNTERMYVAWCKLGEHGKLELLRERAHEVNHFVLLIKLADVGEDVPVDGFPDEGDLELWAENNGFMVMKTICQGDCGIDCMAAYLGMERRPSSWLALRKKLEVCARRVCGRPAWLAGFQMAGEAHLCLENVHVRQKNKKAMLRSKAGVGSTFKKWISKFRRSNRQDTHAPSAGDGAVVLVVGDGVPQQGDEGQAREKSEEFQMQDAEEENALWWALGVPNVKKEAQAPWQLRVWREASTLEEKEAMVRAYRMRNDTRKADGCPRPHLSARCRRYQSTRIDYRMAVARHVEDFLQSEEGREKVGKLINGLSCVII